VALPEIEVVVDRGASVTAGGIADLEGSETLDTSGCGTTPITVPRSSSLVA